MYLESLQLLLLGLHPLYQDIQKKDGQVKVKSSSDLNTYSFFKKDALRRFLPDHLIDQNDVNDIEEDHFTAKVQHCDTEETVMLTIYAPVIFACLRKAAGISHRDFLSVSQQRF